MNVTCFNVFYGIFMEELWRTPKKLVYDPAEIRTSYIPNKCQKTHRLNQHYIERALIICIVALSEEAPNIIWVIK
jgi:hypothetical protein